MPPYAAEATVEFAGRAARSRARGAARHQSVTDPIVISASEPIAGVTYLGAVTDSQLWALYRSAEALVFPSVYEGFGLPILEAMAAGTPVIALPPLRRRYLRWEATPVLYRPGGTSTYGPRLRALEQVATDRELRDELRLRGPLHAAQFRWETTARLTVDAYRSTVFQPSARSLRARRQLRDVLSSWASVGEYRVAAAPSTVFPRRRIRHKPVAIDRSSRRRILRTCAH